MRGRNRIKRAPPPPSQEELEREEAFKRDNKPPTKEDMERLRKTVGRRLANFGILPNLGLGAAGSSGLQAAKTFIRDLRLKIWRDIILEEGWSAKKAQTVAAGTMIEPGFEDAEDRRAVQEVAELLEQDNLLWERWWNADFALFRDDIGADLPSWILVQPPPSGDGGGGVNLERVYGQVPWRRYYAWCQYFQRRCAKIILRLADERATNYVANFEVPDGVPVGVRYIAPEEPIEWTIDPENPDVASVSYERTEREDPNGHVFSLTEIALDMPTFPVQHGSPLMAWLFLDREHGIGVIDLPEVSDVIKEFNQLELTYTTGQQHASRRKRKTVAYEFNFDAESSDALASFMMWYEHRFSQKLAAEGLGEPADADGMRYLEGRADGLTIARALKLEDGFGHWPVLDTLPLIPTRNGIRFIGQEEQEEEEEEPSAAPAKCVLCDAVKPSQMMRERLYPDLIFCGHECHTAFRDHFPLLPIGVNNDGEETIFDLWDTLGPIMLRLPPKALLALSKTNSLARQAFVDPRFRREYVNARFDDMWQVVLDRCYTDGIMEDWTSSVLDDKRVTPDMVYGLARLAERGSMFRRIVSHAKFAEIDDPRVADMLYWLAITNIRTGVLRVLARMPQLRIRTQPGLGIRPLLAVAAQLDNVEMIGILLNSTDPYMISAYTLVLAAYEIARDEARASMPRARQIMELLMSHPRFPEDRKDALRSLYYGRLPKPKAHSSAAGGKENEV